MNKYSSDEKPADRRIGGREIYVLRPPSQSWDGWWWVYAPLARASTLMRDSEVQDLEAATRGAGTVNARKRLVELSEDTRTRSNAKRGLRRLMLVPTAACNFNCRYCFAVAGHSADQLSETMGRSAIDYYLGHSVPGAPLTICFLGGGEPTLVLPLIDRLLDYAELRNNGERPCQFSIVTNGSGNVEDLIDVSFRHKVSIGFSFDILKDAQERDRGHYELVAKNLRALLTAGIEVSIKTTITPDTAPFMSEMVRITVLSWPSVNSIHMEPVLAPAMYSDTEKLRAFYQAFITGWFEASTVAKKYGINLGNSLSAHTRLLLDRFCDGTFLVGPRGILSACEFVSSPQDPGFVDVELGHVDRNGKMMLDGTGHIASQGRRFSCERCFAKWHCAGGCGHRRLVLGATLDSETCRFTREFMARTLFSRFEETMRIVMKQK